MVELQLYDKSESLRWIAMMTVDFASPLCSREAVVLAQRLESGPPAAWIRDWRVGRALAQCHNSVHRYSKTW
jgi:hypothetical protein